MTHSFCLNWSCGRSQTRTVGDGYYCTIFVDNFLLLHTRVVIKSLADGHAPLLLDDRKVETVPMGMQDLGSKIFWIVPSSENNPTVHGNRHSRFDVCAMRVFWHRWRFSGPENGVYHRLPIQPEDGDGDRINERGRESNCSKQCPAALINCRHKVHCVFHVPGTDPCLFD